MCAWYVAFLCNLLRRTAAGLLKLVLICLCGTLPDDVKMFPPVHDSVLLEVPEPLVEETTRIVRDAMETLPEGFSVPLKVEAKTGRTWAACK